ncbi:sigma-70 family RNA polymerase sigma factor [Calycomorphotria hydatis]|uniref:ECF RNA polymerase sigma factor SigK n=1 Tax=Calycomorphotria hydatis TaxID=2528027 RepID=A0A517T3B8_9PLAN|nr:sigma-70 family RNA polymerase sigma factor [Calycomorphotria hydatis]QDT62873.1 ECF RNA polymerase sigma factor SigK [Calycomorphotria hydatis]
MAEPDDEFLRLVTEFQPRLYGYLLSLLADSDATQDVLQETNVVIWRKNSEFQPGTSFKAWAFRIAYLQVMAFRQKQLRDKLVFDDGTLAKVGEDASRNDDLFSGRQLRLEDCLRKLPDNQREIITQRYLRGISVAELAVTMKRSANSISQLLFRARKNLLDCLDRFTPARQES